MTRSTAYELIIEKLSHEGRGIAHLPADDPHNPGKVVFVRNALPGETVRTDKLRMHRRFAEAQAIDILQPSADRVDAPCTHVDICGGCSLMHLATETALAYQTTWVLEQLQHFGQVSPAEIVPPLTGPSLGYRRRARLGVKWVEKKQKLLIGFREHDGRFLADLSACQVLIPEVGHRFEALRELIMSLTAYKAIPQIEISVADQGVILVIRHLQILTDEDLEKIRHFGADQGFIIYLQPKGPDSIICCTPLPAPELSYTLPAFQLQLTFSPGDFLQVNAAINEAMIRQAIAWLAPTKDEHILDLFCGLGNFSLPLATLAKTVVGVEGDNAMVKKATENAQRNGLSNTEFHCANLFEPNENMPWYRGTYDKILLDPPRAGAEQLMPHIAALGAKTIVYVSCNSATLARDLGLLQPYGYQLTKLGLMDMFTHTAHVEVMALLIKS
jgi:23S rRNA (uracil1939-C5)-methyltransferase